jgi:hypothetical protein
VTTVKLRFRPVLFGPSNRPAAVFYLGEDADGQAYFQDLEVSWPLGVPLDEVTVGDLPATYCRDGVVVRILPAQEAIGQTLREASARMDAVLESLSSNRAESTRAGHTRANHPARSA